MELSSYLGTAIVAYLLGSIPTGFLVGRMRGVDIRKVGSGNIGATNVLRILGKTAGASVLLIDALKGFLASGVLAKFVCHASRAASSGAFPAYEPLAIVAGVAAILGHNYTCWLSFKGGKGVATTAGVLLGWVPWGLVVALGVWGTVLAVSRYVSVASIAAALSLPFAVWWLSGSRSMILVSAAVGGLAVYKHRTNIQRLLNGTEPRLGKPRVGSSS